MADQHYVEASYFTPGVAAPDMVVLKEYARYLVRSRVGRISDRLSVNSVQHYVRMIISLLQRACNHSNSIMIDIRQEMRFFVAGDLVAQEGLNNQMHTKAVAHSEDITFILSKLYSPEYLSTFANMRVVLNLTLYMLLVVDLCGRGANIARHPLRPDHMCLRWEDVSFYLFQREDDDSLDIRAQIKVRWAKGQSLKESEYRTIPFPGLLPTSMMLQDTLRLLLVTALMDGVLSGGIQTWEQLCSLRLPAELARTGMRIAIHPRMRNVPVLRRMVKHWVANDPAQTVDIQPEIRRLGRFCGFENRLVGYCLRRGVAYILASHTTGFNRRFLMGHKADKQYLPYQSRVSTVDFVALFRDLDERPVTALWGMSLNRSDQAPLTISKAGQQAILEDDEVKCALEEMEALRNTIKAKHVSLAAAARCSDPLWQDFQRLYEVYRSIVVSLTKQTATREYQEHFNQDRLPHPTISESQQVARRPFDDDDGVGSSLFVPEASQGGFEDQDTIEDALSLIYPRLSCDLGWQGEEFADQMVGEEDAPASSTAANLPPQEDENDGDEDNGATTQHFTVDLARFAAPSKSAF